MKTQEKDESLFDLTDEEETVEDALGEDETSEIGTEIIGSAAETSSTFKNAGIVAVIGIIGYFIAQKFSKKGSGNEVPGQMEANFKPVDFGF